MSVRFAGPEQVETGPRLCASPRFVKTQDSISFTYPEEQTFEKVIRQGNQDEIDDDAMTNLTSVAESIRSGDSDALVVALFETGQALQNCREYAVQVLVPLICDHAVGWEYQLKLSAGETLLTVVNSGKVPEGVAQKIGKAAIVVIGTPCVQQMFEAWSDTLVAVLKYVSWSAKQLDDFLDVLEKVYKPPNNILSRQLTARILGSLAASSKEDGGLKRRVLDRALLLSGNKNVIVRGMVAESFSFIGASASLSEVEKEIWPRLKKLLRDSDARIRAASLQSLSYISSAHREKGGETVFFARLLGPIFLEECARIRRDAAEDQRDADDDKCLLLEVNSEIFGELLYTSIDCLSESEKKEVYKAFLAMCTANGPIVRRYCAYNMPAVALCLSPKYKAEIASLVRFLAQDNDVEARWVLAAGLHETVKILASRESVNDLLKAAQELLEDEKTLVRKNILYHFEELISEISRHSGYGVVEKLSPLFQNLGVLTSENWTVQVALAKQLRLAAPLVPPPSLKMDVLPILYQLADRSAYIGRKAVMVAIATCIRYVPDVRERCEMLKRFREQWGQGAVFWMRIAFLDAAEAAVAIYSRCLFRHTFGMDVLRLAFDQVSNVRLRLASFLPRLAPACNQMEEFHSALEALKSDEDIDVSYLMNGVDEKISAALEEGYRRFEEDMKLEDEEQELYSRHLQAQREVQRKKNVKKHRTGLFLGKAARGIHSTASRATSQTGSFGGWDRDLDSNSELPSNKFAGHSGRPQRSFASASLAVGVSRETNAVQGKSQQGPLRPETRNIMRMESLAFSTEEPNALAASTRGFKGLMNLVSPRNNPLLSRKSSRTRRSLI